VAKLYFDGNMELIRNMVISIIGFGNQGSAQALNLRDGGFRVLIGNIEDEYAKRARDLGFTVHSIPEAVKLGNVIVMENFLNNKGFPVLIGVSNDYSGKAWDYALAYSKAIGAIGRPGGVAVESSFEEETITDLFSEHTWAGAFLFLLAETYNVLIENGVSPEAAMLEL
jgi:ketol-acid reductoisomerase